MDLGVFVFLVVFLGGWGIRAYLRYLRFDSAGGRSLCALRGFAGHTWSRGGRQVLGGQVTSRGLTVGLRLLRVSPDCRGESAAA